MRCIVVAHRGASGYRPEHTLEAYRLAIAQGADYIEPDLVVTADAVPVARHENEISTTTDVADHPEFANRLATKDINGRRVTGWFVEDFTLAELRTLRARERMPGLRSHNQLYDDQFMVPTLTEILELARTESARLGRPIGVYPEIKLPAYFATLGLRVADATVEQLRQTGSGLPVYLQSFDPDCLRTLAEHTAIPLVQLVGQPSALLEPWGLREVSTYAQVLGVHKALLIPRDNGGRLTEPSGLTGRAHDAGLAVHAWTFRSENPFLPAEMRVGVADSAHGDTAAEYAAFLALGVDGVFTDHPDIAVAALAQPVAATT
jgi:glycerophosphoryl diester phosphodiesterase